jgi:selenocysteine lyase/cysteine desulfurase
VLLLNEPLDIIEFAISSVLKSLRIGEGDVVLMFDLNYGAVKYAVEATRASTHLIPLIFPLNDMGDIIQQFRSGLQNLPDSTRAKVRLAIFEHITSPTAMKLPVKQLSEICREFGIYTLIDGAHALGQLDLDLDDLGADFYTFVFCERCPGSLCAIAYNIQHLCSTNGHKWLCNIRGAALFYANPTPQVVAKPVVTSWGHGQGFHAEFVWSGTMDYTPMLTLRSALDFYEAMGGLSRIREYCLDLVCYASRVLTRAWGTELLVPLELCEFMISVRIPEKHVEDEVCLSKEQCGASDLHKDLLEKHSIEAPIFTFKGHQYTRVSCHIYNSREELDALAFAVATIQQLDLAKVSDVVTGMKACK